MLAPLAVAIRCGGDRICRARHQRCLFAEGLARVSGRFRIQRTGRVQSAGMDFAEHAGCASDGGRSGAILAGCLGRPETVRRRSGGGARGTIVEGSTISDSARRASGAGSTLDAAFGRGCDGGGFRREVRRSPACVVAGRDLSCAATFFRSGSCCEYRPIEFLARDSGER